MTLNQALGQTDKYQNVEFSSIIMQSLKEIGSQMPECMSVLIFFYVHSQ